MKFRSLSMIVILFILMGLIVAQDAETERLQKEAAEKAAADKEAAAKAEKEKKELEAVKKEFQTILDKFCKALNGDDADKIVDLCYIEDEKIKKEIQEEFQDEIDDRETLFKDFKVKKVTLKGDVAVVSYSLKVMELKDEDASWFEMDDELLFRKVKKEWKLDITFMYMWSEAKTALGCIKAATDCYSAKTGGDLSIFEEEFTCISNYYDLLRIEPAALQDLEYFDEEDFLIKKVPVGNEGLCTYVAKCQASLGKGRGQSKKGPEFGVVTFDSSTEEWKEDYLQDCKAPEKKEDKKEEKPKVEPKPDDEEDSSYKPADEGENSFQVPPPPPMGDDDDDDDETDDDDDGLDLDDDDDGLDLDDDDDEGPSDEEFKKMLKEFVKIRQIIKEILNKYYEAINNNKIDEILALYEFTDDAEKKEAKEYYTKLLKENKCKYKFSNSSFTSHLDDDQVEIRYEYKTKQIEKPDTQWEKKNGFMRFKKIDNEWKIIYMTQKKIWAEAKTCMGSINNVLDVLKAKYDNDLTDFLSDDWMKVVDIPDELGWLKYSFTDMDFFDKEDFVVKLKEGSKSDFIVKCDASLGKGRGESKTGPEKGTIIYESDTKKWTESYKPDEKNEDKKEEKPKVEPKPDDE